MTEFTSADGLARMRETKRRRYLTFYDDEHPIGAQLFGSNPETLADSGAHCGGDGLRHRRSESGLPGQTRGEMQRRVGPAARSAEDRRNFQAPLRKAVTIPFTVKVPAGLERLADCVRGAGAHGGG
jgi:tRNA-dihydrouridine synthase B